MKQSRLTLSLFSLFILVSLILSACGSAATAVPSPTEAAAPVMTVVGSDGERAFSMDELKALPVSEGQGGIKSSTGKITIPQLFKGVSIKDLISALGGKFDESMGVTLFAEDGYSITFSYDQIMNGNFIAYDPSNGNEMKTHDPLTAIIAYELGGKALDPRTDGNLRLAVISTKNNQVVDGHWAVKWVNKLVVKAVGQVWTLDIEGAIADKVDRGSFESCGSPSCHGLTWTDDSTQVWAGVPFWRLVGQVDDENNHGTGGFNVTLADKGYTVDVIAKDGYTVTLDSKNIKLNDDILLAYMVNDTELPEKYFPLRLVGKGLEKSQMAGQIAKIVVKIPATAAPTETSAPTMGTTTESTGSLVISGLVTNELKLGETELRAMGVADITAEHPKKGKQNYSGVRLSQLLIVAQVKPEATKLVLTASDGYSAEIDLAAVRGCPDCMIAFTDTPETFFLVMSGQESGTWVKNISRIEVK